MDDYTYMGVEYQGDPDMVLPDGEEFSDELGKNDVHVFILRFLEYLMFLCF
jgi:hypothetical protein